MYECIDLNTVYLFSIYFFWFCFGFFFLSREKKQWLLLCSFYCYRPRSYVLFRLYYANLIDVLLPHWLHNVSCMEIKIWHTHTHTYIGMVLVNKKLIVFLLLMFTIMYVVHISIYVLFDYMFCMSVNGTYIHSCILCIQVCSADTETYIFLTV